MIFLLIKSVISKLNKITFLLQIVLVNMHTLIFVLE